MKAVVTTGARRAGDLDEQGNSDPRSVLRLVLTLVSIQSRLSAFVSVLLPKATRH